MFPSGTKSGSMPHIKAVTRLNTSQEDDTIWNKKKWLIANKTSQAFVISLLFLHSWNAATWKRCRGVTGVLRSSEFSSIFTRAVKKHCWRRVNWPHYAGLCCQGYGVCCIHSEPTPVLQHKQAFPSLCSQRHKITTEYAVSTYVRAQWLL